MVWKTARERYKEIDRLADKAPKTIERHGFTYRLLGVMYTKQSAEETARKIRKDIGGSVIVEGSNHLGYRLYSHR